MKNKIVIGLVGEKGSGKGTVAKYLESYYKADHYTVSDILKEMSKLIYLPETRENLIQLALVLKKGFWSTILIDALINRVNASEKRVVVADGLRLPEDIEPFKQEYGKKFMLIYVTADTKIRYERIRTRKEKIGEDLVTFLKFKEQEKLPTERKIKKVGEQANFKITNNESIEDLYEQIDNIIRDTLAKK